MPSPARILLVCIGLTAAVLTGFTASAAPPSEAIIYLENLPASHPYREILLRYAELPDTEREQIGAWSRAQDTARNDDAVPTPRPTLTAEQSNLVREVAAALLTARDQPALTADDWPRLPNPAEPDNPAATILPAIGLTRELAYIAATHADTLPPDQALPLYAATAHLARQQRAGATLIEQLTGVAVEGIAHAAASRRLGEFSTDQLRELSAAWSELPPPPTLAQAFSGERGQFFLPIVENLIRPGLHALLAAPDAGLDPDAGFTRDLRLSGLVDLGDGERRISLENQSDGTSLSLREGGPAVTGIRLVNIDFERREALIRRGTQEAVIHLQSKRIVERHPAQAAARLRKLLADFEGWQPDTDKTKPGTLLERLLDRARAHPGGADGYADQLIRDYDQILAEQIAAAAEPRVGDMSRMSHADPLLRLTLPSFGRVARTLNNSATSATMLQAAIHQRLVDLGGAADHRGPSDPWAGEEGVDFIHEPTPDGGFVLRSRYEFQPDVPLTYKFAAPDAGFVRQP